MRLFLCTVILLMLGLCLGKEKRNPFMSVLPKRKKIIKKVKKVIEEEKKLDTKSIKLEGIVWGEDKACAIINGEVYTKGDRIKEVGAEILEINKNGISLKYGKRIYEINMELELGKER